MTSPNARSCWCDVAGYSECAMEDCDCCLRAARAFAEWIGFAIDDDELLKIISEAMGEKG